MTLSSLKNQFISGIINKAEYIDRMYELHQMFFEYAQFITDTNISEIQIISNKVVVTFKDSDAKFVCVERDKRLAPFDAINFGRYEEEELAMQLHLIGTSSRIYDIGANIGWFAITVAKKNPSAEIFSFEPIPVTYSVLTENILLNKVNNIKALNYGFSESDGFFEFYFDPTLSVNASMVNVADKQNIATMQCVVKTLDEFSKTQNKPVDFIKCDVEGAELLVFRGGRELINKDKPIIFAEMLRKWTKKFNYHPNDIISFFKEYGYQCYTCVNEKLVPFGLVNENTVETNYFFLHGVQHQKQLHKYSL